MDIATALRFDGKGKFRLSRFDSADTHGVAKDEGEEAVEKHVEKLAALHDLLYAEHRRSLLIVLQGMDAAGKDGTIRHVMSGVNPQGCSVVSFKEPTRLELDHDFLWRIHAAVPPKGTIGIFNRSHYEDVIVARVHELVPEAVWKRRYGQINDFESILAANNVVILKFFLHLSKAEQKKRLQSRLTDPAKNWKADAADFRERRHWAGYESAYEDAIAEGARKDAPWYIIPSDHKWFRNFAVGEVIVRTLEGLGMAYPRISSSALTKLRDSH
jgi:PPK2 family polyphosphate:nucleotide phosphotransferase